MKDKDSRSIWDNGYASRGEENPNDGEFWLDPWGELIGDGPSRVLELGCGGGFDARALLDRGHRVAGADFSIEALKLARRISPEGVYVCLDMRAAFPFLAASFDAVIAHLSLHYFSWAHTRQIFRQVYAVLDLGGVFIARVSAKGDRQHLAAIIKDSPKIETDYYQVNGVGRRYFTGASLQFLLSAPWKTTSLEEKTISRQGRPKLVWEFACQK